MNKRVCKSIKNRKEALFFTLIWEAAFMMILNTCKLTLFLVSTMRMLTGYTQYSVMPTINNFCEKVCSESKFKLAWWSYCPSFHSPPSPAQLPFPLHTSEQQNWISKFLCLPHICFRGTFHCVKLASDCQQPLH